MPVNVLGFQTHRDKIAVAHNESILIEQVANFIGRMLSKEEIAEYITRCAYRVFDRRFVCLSPDVCDRPRRELLDHVVNRKNLCLGIGRQGIAVQDPIWSLITISIDPMDANIFRRGGANVFPLWIYPQREGLMMEESRYPNLTPGFFDRLANALSLKPDGSLPGDLKPEQVTEYSYGVLHSPKYRTRYAEFLKIDFPHLPLPRGLGLFRKLANLGSDLIAIHLMESPKLGDCMTTYMGSDGAKVGRVGWSDNTVWLDAGKTNAREGYRATQPGTIGFQGVPEAVWNFSIGGYQICHKWLKDRKGHILSCDEIDHYQKIVVALNETIRIMKEIDEVIDEHGGWPGAFVTEK